MIKKEDGSVRLVVAEEQELYRNVYRTIFPAETGIMPVDITMGIDYAIVSEKLTEHRPDVLLMSTMKLEREVIETLQQVRSDFPDVGVMMTFLLYSNENVRLLRQLVIGARGGVALFLKQSLVKIDEFCGIIISVAGGQVIIDPTITNPMFSEKQEDMLLRGLTARELEILDLMAKGYTNAAIAETLFIDIRTVENHINNVYSKLKADARFSNRHPRVSAARLYLETTGELVKAGVSS
jgi:DNA-binding NarL/FixJ family response regulator